MHEVVRYIFISSWVPEVAASAVDKNLWNQCSHLELDYWLCSSNQEKLLKREATPLYSSVCLTAPRLLWVLFTTAPGFQVSSMSWWSKALLLRSSSCVQLSCAFTSLSATAQGLYGRSIPLPSKILNFICFFRNSMNVFIQNRFPCITWDVSGMVRFMMLKLSCVCCKIWIAMWLLH